MIVNWKLGILFTRFNYNNNLIIELLEFLIITAPVLIVIII